MEQKQIQMEELLKQAEQELAENPKEYEKKLMRYSLLGYGVIAILVVVLGVLVGGTIFLALSSTLFVLLLFQKKLIIPLLIMVWVLFKSVFIRFPKPEGMVLNKALAPELFDSIEDIRQQLDAAPVHQVIVTPELNAAIIQTPRFLAFGFTHNTLVLGFELLLSLTAEELKSVIAHELGHLSGNHSKFQGWIYRSRDSWRNMMFNLDQHNSWTTAPIRKFFNWYSPMFSAYSFALARLNEYEADKVAAQFSSNLAASSALIKMPVYSQFIQEKHWTKFNEKVITHPEPPEMPYASLVRLMENTDIPQSEASSAIEFAKKATTNYHDTHPCLTERLASLGCSDMAFVQTSVSAGRTYLGNVVDEIAGEIDKAWAEFSIENWKQEHDIAQKEKQQLNELQRKDVEQLSQSELWDWCWMFEKFQESDSADAQNHAVLERYQIYNTRFPNDIKGTFAVGRLLILDKNEDGLTYLQQAMRKDELIEPAGHLAYEYLVDKGEPERANQWLSKVFELEEIFQAASEERSKISHKDELHKPETDLALFKEVTDVIQQHKRVQNVWLAQKKVKHFTESPVLIFAVQAKRGFYISDDLPQKLIELLPDELPLDAVAFIVTKTNDGKLFKKVLANGDKLT